MTFTMNCRRCPRLIVSHDQTEVVHPAIMAYVAPFGEAGSAVLSVMFVSVVADRVLYPGN
jgi:hypothetical protein